MIVSAVVLFSGMAAWSTAENTITKQYEHTREFMSPVSNTFSGLSKIGQLAEKLQTTNSKFDDALQEIQAGFTHQMAELLSDYATFANQTDVVKGFKPKLRVKLSKNDSTNAQEPVKDPPKPQEVGPNLDLAALNATTQ
jgi:hypothetical protein